MASKTENQRVHRRVANEAWFGDHRGDVRHTTGDVLGPNVPPHNVDRLDAVLKGHHDGVVADQRRSEAAD